MKPYNYRDKIHQEIADKWFEETYKDFDKHVCYGPKQLDLEYGTNDEYVEDDDV